MTVELDTSPSVEPVMIVTSRWPWPCLCFRDEKQIDFAEQVESVAYVLCGEDAITLDKFCQIFQAKGVSSKLHVYYLEVEGRKSSREQRRKQNS
jgi:hypothetical protein